MQMKAQLVKYAELEVKLEAQNQRLDKITLDGFGYAQNHIILGFAQNSQFVDRTSESIGSVK